MTPEKEKTMRISLRNAIVGSVCFACGAWPLEAATYSDAVTNMGVYAVQGVTDTWNRSLLTVTNGTAVDSGGALYLT